jgi:hypothetical protein
MADDSLPFNPAQGRPPVLFGGTPDVQGDRFTRMAAEEIDLDRAISNRGVSDRARSRSSRGIADIRVRLDATRLAHQARSWDDLLFLIRRQLHSHAISDPEDAKLLIDIATSAYGAERGDSDSAWFYALSLQKEVDDKAAAARQQDIGIRAQQLRNDPVLRANLEWQDRVQKLADETGVEYQFAAEFIKEYDRLSAPRFPGVIDPRSVPFIQLEVPLYQSAYLIDKYILRFTPVGPLLGVYEGVTGKDFLTGERLATWERVLNIVTSLLPFAGPAVRGGAKAVAVGIKLVGQEFAAAAKAMAHLAAQIRTSARAMLRFVAKLAKLPAARVQALLDRVTVARRASQGLRLASDEVRLAREMDGAIKELDVVEAGARPRSMTASGVIDDGRALTKTQSGTINAKPAPTPTAPGAGTVRALSRAAASLIDAGYLPQAIEALEKMGIKVTAKVAGSLKALGTTGRDFLNLFHESKGFHRVVGDLLKGGSKKIGAEFVMRFATRHPDLLAKVRANPLNVAFEWGAGVKKTRRFGDIFAREIDIVVRGDAAIGEGNTIYNELKSWTEDTLRTSKGKKLPQQLARDTALLDPHNIRWVFDASKMGDKKKIIAIFAELIQRDPYLTKAWGTDRAAITAALDRVVMVF